MDHHEWNLYQEWLNGAMILRGGYESGVSGMRVDFFRGPRGIQSRRFRLGCGKDDPKGPPSGSAALENGNVPLPGPNRGGNRFLGLPTGRVSAHSRHIQESMFLSRAQRLAEWNRAKWATPKLAPPRCVAGTEPPV